MSAQVAFSSVEQALVRRGLFQSGVVLRGLLKAFYVCTSKFKA
jgi:hypothetical protein